MRARLGAPRPILRLAWRDARRHWKRTLLATLLVMIPALAMVTLIGTMLSGTPSREAALATIPDGAQAIITATAIRRPAPPFPQLPEGATFWMDDEEQLPMSAGDIEKVLSENNSLIPFWRSPALLATTKLTLEPGEASAAAAAKVTAALRPSDLDTMTLTESATDGLAHLMPPIREGKAPKSQAEIVVSSGLAKALQLEVGATIALLAPPDQGWRSLDGRNAAAVEDQSRAYRVVGVADGDAQQAWALPGLVAEAIVADPLGIDGHYLVVGPDPVTWNQAKNLNHQQAFAVSRHVLNNYPSADELYPVAVNQTELATQLLLLLMSGLMSGSLMLALILPAFAVAADQSRRVMGLATAVGATPTDLRRILTSQGLGIGLVGGLVGAAGGVAIAVVIRRKATPDVAVLHHYPWWIVLATVTVTTTIAWLVTAIPANRVARLDPVLALRLRPSAAGDGRVERPLRRAFVVALLALIAVACGSLALRLPLPAAGLVASPSVPAPLLVLVLAAFGAAVASLWVSLPLVLNGITKLRRPLPLRMAAQDARRHRGRSLPAAGAVLACTTAISALAIYSGSFAANAKDLGNSLVGPGRLILAPETPISDDFDRAMLGAVVDLLADDYPVTGHEPVWSFGRESKERIELGVPTDKECPKDQAPTVASRLDPEADFTCIEYTREFRNGFALPWWLGDDVLVMSGDALRASGLPHADQAAAALDSGGVVVDSLAALSEDGLASVLVVKPKPSGINPTLRSQQLPGYFLPRVAASLIVSPTTAAQLTDTKPVYVGEYVATSRPLTNAEVAAAKDKTDRFSTLAKLTTAPRDDLASRPWTLGLFIVLGLVALFATVVALLLARTQSVADFATMHAVGASPRFLRIFGTAQAGLLLLLGLPLGLVGGTAIGLFLVAWQRHAQVSGPWRFLGWLWPIQGGVVITLVAAGLLVAWLVSRPPTGLVRRTD